MSPIFNFNLFNIPTAAAVAFMLMASGGGAFALVRRNWRRARQPDPEAIELAVTRTVERRAAPGSANDAGVPENTVAAEDAGAAGQGGAVEGDEAFSVGDDEGDAGQCVVLSVGDDEGAFEVYGVGALEETSASDVAGTLEVCGAVKDDLTFGVPAST